MAKSALAKSQKRRAAVPPLPLPASRITMAILAMTTPPNGPATETIQSQTDAPHSAAPAPETEVFAVFGVEPEVQAYAMAKYSRSALSMKESLKKSSEQKAEKFVNTFYFLNGQRSIADLAHIAMA